MSKRKSTTRIRTNKGLWKAGVLAERRKAAEDRQKAYDAIPLVEKIRQCELGLRGKKEHVKLLKKLEKIKR